MKDEPIKICSSCGAEYSLMAQVCADCGGKLVSPQEYETRFVPLTEEEELVLVREGSAAYLKELSAHMTKRGVRASIVLLGGKPGTCPSAVSYGLYVETADADAAKEIARAHWIKGAPDHAATFEYAEQELQGTCPACSTALPERAIECPKCGLVVGFDEEAATCPDCDAAVGDDVDKCPNCGAEFE